VRFGIGAFLGGKGRVLNLNASERLRTWEGTEPFRFLWEAKVKTSETARDPLALSRARLYAALFTLPAHIEIGLA
jgi:hypothetical protein